MPWTKIVPKNSGGGRPPDEPAATMYESGQLTLTASAVKMLGNPERVRLEVDAQAERIRLTPTTPADGGGFSLSGGGNSPARIGCRDAVRRYEGLIGKYSVQKIAGGVELRKVEE